MVYADTSVLASYYLRDSNGATAAAIMSALRQPLLFSAIHRLELRNALELANFRGDLGSTEVQRIWGLVARDRRAGLLVRLPILWEKAFRQAYALSRVHSHQLGTRSFDLLHVAVARELKFTTFIRFDKRQRVSASDAGLTVLP